MGNRIDAFLYPKLLQSDKIQPARRNHSLSSQTPVSTPGFLYGILQLCTWVETVHPYKGK